MNDLPLENAFQSTAELLEECSESRIALLAASDDWCRAFQSHMKRSNLLHRSFDDRSTSSSFELYHQLMIDVQDKLDACCCMLFLVSSKDCGTLYLEAAMHNFDSMELTPVTMAFIGAPNSIEEPLQLLEPVFTCPTYLQVVCSKDSSEILDIPIVDNQDVFQGLIRVSRPLDANMAFSEKDRIIGELLVEKYMPRLERLSPGLGEMCEHELLSILKELDAGLSTIADELTIGKLVLSQAARLVCADRADLVLWDDDKKDLVIQAQFGGPVDEHIRVTRSVPHQSIIRDVWSKGGYKYVHNVDGVDGYYPADPKTQSELVIRIDTDDRAIGVLNMESYQVSGFGEQAVMWLRLLSYYVSNAKVRTAKEPEPIGLLKHLTEKTIPATDVLKLTLQSVQAYRGYDAGLIYYADFAKRRLICVESIGCEHLGSQADITQFSFSFDDRSLACRVFHERQSYFCDDPTNDKFVSQDGVEYFNIRGPLVGVPLIYNERAVGVMVVWSRNGTLPHRGTPAQLAPFVQLAAPSIAAKTDGQFHEAMLQAAEDMLRIRESSNSDEEVLLRAVEFIQRAGFDRVRLFKFDPSEAAFMGRVSAGMAAPTEFSKLKVTLADNPYARHTAASAITNPRARKYDGQFGPDPDALELEKQTDVAWLVAPLVVNQRLFGQVVVDNANTRRAFEQRDFEYLTFLATMLAETLSNVDSVETMRQKALPILLQYLSIQDSIEAFVRRFLVYVTSGRGLGFSRAVFLELHVADQRLVPYDGIGSINFEEFDRIAKDVASLNLHEQLRLAATVSDEELNMALQDFSYNLTNEQLSTVLAHGPGGRRVISVQVDTSSPLSPLALVLAQRIRGSQYLVAPIHAGEDLRGLLVVDRNWQGRPLGATDQAQLEAFVELAEFLVSDHARTRRAMESLHADATIGRLARSQPEINPAHLRQLMSQINAVRGSLIDLDYVEAESKLDVIQADLSKATNSLERLVSLWMPSTDPEPTHPRTLVKSVVDCLQSRYGDAAPIMNVLVTGKVPAIQVYVDSLWTALYEVLLNACEAQEKSADAKKQIDIQIDCCEEYLTMEVLDAGPGISEEVLSARRFKVDAQTTNSDKGLGFGLLKSQAIVELIHGGCFEVMKRTDRSGTRVTIRIPLAIPMDRQKKERRLHYPSKAEF